MVVIGAADEPVLSFKATACDGKSGFQNNACNNLLIAPVMSALAASMLVTNVDDGW